MDDILNGAAANLTSELVRWLAVGSATVIATRYKPILRWARANIRGFGGTRRAKRLRELIAQYENFTHEQELETHSKAFRYAVNAALCLLWGGLISLPLLAILSIAFGEAIIFDVVANLKPGTQGHLPDVPGWLLRGWGFVIGAFLSGSLTYLIQATDEASALSASHRKKMLPKWRDRLRKIEDRTGIENVSAAGG